MPISEALNEERRRDLFDMRVEGRMDKVESFFSFADLNITGRC